jgi:hypothetical protein
MRSSRQKAQKAQMQNLYPIIRRKRRPLIEVEATPAKQAPVQSVVKEPKVEPVKIQKSGDAENPVTTETQS